MPRKLDCGAVAGYSGTPLAQKLGLKPGLAAALLHPPRGFFTRSRRQLAAQLPALRRALAPAGALWISWPKQASGRSEEHTSELQSQSNLVCRLLLEKKNMKSRPRYTWQANC